jgi:hypothetical protein
MAQVQADLRRRILRAFVGQGVLQSFEVKDMLSYKHSGFSVDTSVRIEAHDRAGLERLLRPSTVCHGADPRRYASFNQFFTRPLKADARPLSDATWICPVDGAISQFGAMQHNQLVQAKGHLYSDWNRYQAVILIALYRSLARDRFRAHCRLKLKFRHKRLSGSCIN